jgi:hypothetical protein
MATRAKKKPVAARAKRAGTAVNFAAIAREVEEHGRACPVPGRKLAMVPLAYLRRMRQLERRVAEDEADAQAFLAREREPGEWRPWSEIRANLDL